MTTAPAAGEHLARRHRGSADPDGLGPSLLDFAERSRADDWSLRAALVRLAQPEPVRVSQVLEVVRRIEAALGPVRRSLERHPALCDRAVSAMTVTGPPQDPYPDIRVADLARLVSESPSDLDAVITGYESVAPLTDDERLALPLLVVVLDLDRLADVLARWAASGPFDPPLSAVDDTLGRCVASLDALGVPREEDARPPRGRRSRADRKDQI